MTIPTSINDHQSRTLATLCDMFIPALLKGQLLTKSENEPV